MDHRHPQYVQERPERFRLFRVDGNRTGTGARTHTHTGPCLCSNVSGSRFSVRAEGCAGPRPHHRVCARCCELDEIVSADETAQRNRRAWNRDLERRIWAYLSLCEHHAASVDEILAALQLRPGRRKEKKAAPRTTRTTWDWGADAGTSYGSSNNAPDGPRPVRAGPGVFECFAFHGAPGYMVALRQRPADWNLAFLDSCAEEIDAAQQVALGPGVAQ